MPHVEKRVTIKVTNADINQAKSYRDGDEPTPVGPDGEYIGRSGCCPIALSMNRILPDGFFAGVGSSDANIVQVGHELTRSIGYTRSSLDVETRWTEFVEAFDDYRDVGPIELTTIITIQTRPGIPIGEFHDA